MKIKHLEINLLHPVISYENIQGTKMLHLTGKEGLMFDIFHWEYANDSYGWICNFSIFEFGFYLQYIKKETRDAIADGEEETE